VFGRFEFVFTLGHALWLNLVEGFFGKMSRQMLKGIRVAIKDELVTRIYKYFERLMRILLCIYGVDIRMILIQLKKFKLRLSCKMYN